MIIYATYYDHIDRANYHPELIIKNWDSCDRRIIFASRQEEADTVHEKRGVDAEVIVINKGISCPADISAAQNYCVDYCHNTLGAEWLAYFQGDNFLTKSGDDYISARIHRKDVTCLAFNVIAVRLYSLLWPMQTSWLSWKQRMVWFDQYGDGAAHNCNHKIDADGMIIDVGYLGTPQYLGKMRNHNHIWPDVSKERWVSMHSKNLNKAINMAYQAAQIGKQTKLLLPIDREIYEEAIEFLGLEDDYEMCMSVIKDYL